MGTVLSGNGSVARVTIGPAIDLIRNIIAGARLSLFLPVGQWHFRSSIAQVVLLGIVSVGFNFGYDFWMTRPNHYFSIDGLNYQSTLYLLFLLSVVLIAAMRRAFHSIVLLLVMILSITPTTFIIYAAALWALQWQTLLSPPMAYQVALGAYLLWYLAIVLRVFHKVLHPGPLAGGLAFAIYVLLNIVPWFVLPNTPLWEAETNFASAAPESADPDLEELFQRQPRLLDNAAAMLQAERPQTIDLYFVGVAGYGDEDVFMNEAQAARRLFDERFDTRGRSLLLVNNQKTLSALPMASTRNLRGALQLAGRRMNPEEDVLVMFLTSHGDEDSGLALDAGFYEFDPLTPTVLHELLTEARIKWRVIIVSACYSGGFVEELQDPSTLIITSSRADRSSFGCGHDGDFTYFGQALIGGRLRDELSFVSAFEKAKADIGEREKREGRTPSEPQIFVGTDIRPLLDKLIEQLKAGRDHPDAKDASAFAGIMQKAHARSAAVN